ncbi:MAG: tRNA epoxyqueuosine(34) reductase QueG [Anaerolineaceae bacterium]|jgi:epoxyqueuosine reductase
MSLKAKIKAGAESLGFVAIGFTSPEPVPGIQRFRAWVNKNHHAGMTYLASQRSLDMRSDPRRLLPSCQTVISLLSTYPASGDLRSDNVPGQETGAIAAYALVPDYHDVLKQRLAKLSELITELAGNDIEMYACVDSAPILEKSYAQKAGLGWIGRNSLLLHPDYGSWTHLAELLVSLELEPDRVFERDGCGDCQLCVRACPTGAILPERTIDARRCLSYLTIENRGPIPIEFRMAMGKRVFGCDQCQSVCPVNKRAHVQFQEKVIEKFPDLVESFGLSEEKFKLKYRHTPVWRAKYTGFRRNVAIAMGNSGKKDFIPLLEKSSLTEHDPIVADAIAWALGELSS